MPFLVRQCTQDWKVPKTDVIIRKGEYIRISVQGIHWDPEYYPEPEKFNPERFSEEEKSKRPTCAYMPFGEGPRICIGKLKIRSIYFLGCSKIFYTSSSLDIKTFRSE